MWADGLPHGVPSKAMEDPYLEVEYFLVSPVPDLEGEEGLKIVYIDVGQKWLPLVPGCCIEGRAHFFNNGPWARSRDGAALMEGLEDTNLLMI